MQNAGVLRQPLIAVADSLSFRVADLNEQAPRYKWSHLIENFFGKLREVKRIAMRAAPRRARAQSPDQQDASHRDGQDPRGSRGLRPGRVCSVRPKRANRAPSTIGAPLDADDVASGASSIQRRRDRRCDRVRRSPDRIVVEVCVAGGRLDRSVPEKLPNYGQPETSSSADAGEAVAQVVQPEALDASPPRDNRLGTLQIRSRLRWTVAVDDVVASAGQRGDDGEGRGFKTTRFGMGQVQHASTKIDLSPSKIEDLAQSASGE
jgi:hypothetical protein